VLGVITKPNVVYPKTVLGSVLRNALQQNLSICFATKNDLRIIFSTIFYVFDIIRFSESLIWRRIFNQNLQLNG
jgi:hypothetical protein